MLLKIALHVNVLRNQGHKKSQFFISYFGEGGCGAYGRTLKNFCRVQKRDIWGSHRVADKDKNLLNFYSVCSEITCTLKDNCAFVCKVKLFKKE
jgi:hypothetical protein